MRLGYVPTLDGIRAYAILGVMAVHAHVPWLQGGFLGVDAFFVLSGFLITTVLLEEWTATGSISFRSFYARRALRLMPALYALALVVALWTALGLDGEMASANWSGLVLSLLYVSNWSTAFQWLPLGVFPATWSLSVEEQFYLVWPVTLAWMFRSRLRLSGMLLILLSLSAASAILRGMLWDVSDPATAYPGYSRAWVDWYGVGTMERAYTGSDTRADQLLIGCMLALLMHRGWVPATPAVRRIVNVGIVVFGAPVAWIALSNGVPQASWYLWHGGQVALAVAVALLIVRLIHFPDRLSDWIFGTRPIIWIGSISYGLYIWYELVFYLVDESSLWPRPVWRIGLTIVVAAISSYVVERPALRLKRRFRTRETRGDDAATVPHGAPVEVALSSS